MSMTLKVFVIIEMTNVSSCELLGKLRHDTRWNSMKSCSSSSESLSIALDTLGRPVSDGDTLRSPNRVVERKVIIELSLDE